MANRAIWSWRANGDDAFGVQCWQSTMPVMCWSCQRSHQWWFGRVFIAWTPLEKVQNRTKTVKTTWKSIKGSQTNLIGRHDFSGEKSTVLKTTALPRSAFWWFWWFSAQIVDFLPKWRLSCLTWSFAWNRDCYVIIAIHLLKIAIIGRDLNILAETRYCRPKSGFSREERFDCEMAPFIRRIMVFQPIIKLIH